MSRFLAVLFVGLGLAVCCTSVATAQDAGADDLITDRPDFTESGVVVPKGSVQIGHVARGHQDLRGPGSPDPLGPPSDG